MVVGSHIAQRGFPSAVGGLGGCPLRLQGCPSTMIVLAGVLLHLIIVSLLVQCYGLRVLNVCAAWVGAAPNTLASVGLNSNPKYWWRIFCLAYRACTLLASLRIVATWGLSS